MRHLLVESSKVEFVLDVVFINLTEEFITTEPTEPGNPGHLLRATHLYVRGRTGDWDWGGEGELCFQGTAETATGQKTDPAAADEVGRG